jgi:hypothetical protein
MALQGWLVVDGPYVQDDTSASATTPPRMALLTAWCGVEEFDIEVLA